MAVQGPIREGHRVSDETQFPARSLPELIQLVSRSLCCDVNHLLLPPSRENRLVFAGRLTEEGDRQPCEIPPCGHTGLIALCTGRRFLRGIRAEERGEE